MQQQAVRRSRAYLAARSWWRGLDLASQADAIGAATAFLVYFLAALFGPELLR